jgi:hypothetical protein
MSTLLLTKSYASVFERIYALLSGIPLFWGSKYLRDWDLEEAFDQARQQEIKNQVGDE